MTRRVVITGIGAVSPVGTGKDAFWEGLSAGRCAIKPITRFDTTGYKAHLAAELPNFDPTLYMEKKEARRADLYCQYAMAAAKLAVEDASISFDGCDTARTGVIVGSGVGGLTTLETEHGKLMEKGPGRVSPFFIPMMIANMAAGMISIAYGLRGASYAPVSACASGAHALGEAFRAIKHGYMDAALAGGTEAVITPMALAGFSNMTAMSESDDPNAASLPFDKRRTGFVMGEGAGILYLETLESALARGATVYAELMGYGATSDAYHITGPHPDGDGAANAMQSALTEGGLSSSDIGYINAHGTGTPANDKMESAAIRRVFGETPPPVSSTKSMTGHLLGAAGGIEAAAVALTIQNSLIPPTINYREPDPDCPLDVVPNAARVCEVRYALSNSLGFGGHNASLLFGKVN